MRCDQCEALMINGVFCHETGCPNHGKTYVDGLWFDTHECPECGTVHEDYDDMAVCCAPVEEPERHCIVDGQFGIHVPTRFATKFRNNNAYCVLNVTPADWDELERGPDVDGYWDLWQEICDAAVVIDNETRQRFRLEQDGDLFLVAE